MKNLKKVIALIAVLALTLSTVALGATYTDVAEDSAYSVAVESLSKLGIVTGYEDGTYGPEKAVTRAEMAALIARIQGYDETAKAQTATVFTDVPASFWGSGYVAAASNMGIVNGYGDGTFGPDDAVKYEQAVTMIMRTLGYEPFAAANGGYPTGYLAAAQRYGLTKNVSNAVSGTDANRGTIAQLLYNGIDTPLMAQSGWGSDIKYEIYDGTSGKEYKTLMSENLGVVKIKGVVVENATTKLDGEKGSIDTTKEPAVAVNVEDVYDTTNKDFPSASEAPKKYLTGDSDIADFLGYRVIFYVMEDEDSEDYVVISCAKDSATNDTVEFTLDQYAGLDGDVIEYYKNATDNKTTELELDDADVVYNYVGGYKADAVFDKIVKADSAFGGKVTLIDNDNKNGYDVAIVEIGVSAVVDEVTKSKVVLKEAAALATEGSISSILIDEDAEDEIIVYVKDGAVISPADLVEWDVITIVANNRDAKVKFIEVIGSTVSGSVASRKASDTSDTGYAYKIVNSYYDIASSAYDADKIEVGGAGVFYIDNYGKIVAFVEDETVVGGSAKNYAFVMEYGTKTEFNKTTAQIRLLTANGIDIYDVAKEFELDGADGSLAAIDTELLDTVIQYKVNSAGEIKSIVTADNAGDDFEELETTDEFVSYEAEDFDLDGDVDADAKVFILGGKSGSWSTTTSFVGTLADLEDKGEYIVDKYFTGKGEECDIVVIKAGYAKAGASSTIAVLTEISEGVNEAEEDAFMLSFYKDGQLFENVYTTEDVYTDVSGLTVGDIVKVKVSSANVVTSIEKVVDFAEVIRSKEDGLMSATSVNGGYVAGTDEVFTFSYVADYAKNSKKYTIDSKEFKLVNAENVYVIDASAKNVDIYVGAAADCEYDKDITKGFDKYCDYVLVREYDGDIIDVVIIKNVLEIDYSVFNVEA